MARSDGYNPFCYLRSDTDALKLVTNLIRNTTPKGASQNDPFWEKAETALLTAFILYLLHEAPKEEQNFSTVMYMIENAAASEEDENYESPVDELFRQLEMKDENHIALKQYRVFKQAAGKTAKSILISAAVRLAAFNLPELAYITDSDDMDLGSLGERKRAILPLFQTTTPALISLSVCSIHRRFRSCITGLTTSTTGVCQYTFTLSWTSLQTSRYQKILKGFWQPCAAARFPSASSFKIWHN